MFDLERYLISKGVGNACAHVIVELFGDRLTQATLQKAYRGNGVFELPNFTIQKDKFNYTGQIIYRNEIQLPCREVISVRLEPDGSLYYGLYDEDKDFSVNDETETVPEVLIIEVPHFGERDFSSCTYEEETINDYIETRRAENPNLSDDDIIQEMLSGNKVFSSKFYEPDVVMDDSHESETYDEVLASIKGLIHDPLRCYENHDLEDIEIIDKISFGK